MMPPTNGEEERLRSRLRALGLQCRTAQQARVFVQFALACVRETPAGPGQTVFDLLIDSRGRNAVETAERWLRGSTTPSWVHATEDPAGDAARESGAGYAHATGAAAALNAALFLAHAASEAAELESPHDDLIQVAGQTEDEAQQVVMMALQAAYQARRAAQDLGEAVRVQDELVSRIWPEAPR
jgi:hypothetical protein